MDVAYRPMRLEDEEAVIALRMKMWGGPSIEHVRQGARLDPDYLRHTFVAIGADGALLSTVRYWLRDIRDAHGAPQRVGCVASVVTEESARRRGHASALMRLAIEAMREDGCAWSLLMSSRMGVPLYLGLGYKAYPLPYFEDVLSGGQPTANNGYSVETIDPPFDFEDDRWSAVHRLYATYNASRPLSLVRDAACWTGYFTRRVLSRARTHRAALFMARSAGGEYAGYALADYSLPGGPMTDTELDSRIAQLITLGEIGLLPGHNEALPNLLAAVLAGATHLPTGLSARVPRDGFVGEAVRALLPPDPRMGDCGMMALPLAEGVTHEQIAAIFTAPGALFWIVDDF